VSPPPKAVRPVLTLFSGPFTQKKNPLRNKAVLFRLNPYAKTLRRQELIRQERKKAKGSVKKSVPGAAGKEFLDILHAA
jgi:large subunit ribosomal protein L4e